MKDWSQELWYMQMPHEKIVEFIAVIEACEGLAVPRVLNKEHGLVELLVAPDLEAELEQVLAGLKESFPLARISRPEGIKSIADGGEEEETTSAEEEG